MNMNPDDFIPLFRAAPFVPFTVRMNNGDSYRVSHPEQAMITGETLHIAGRHPDGYPDVTRCAMINIASVNTADDAEVA